MTAEAPLLLDLFGPVIDRGLMLSQQAAHGPPETPAADLNREIFQALRQAREAARTAGKTDAPVLAASFALAAWIDDLLSVHQAWYGQTPRLTRVLFKTDDGVAGTVDRLRALPPEETDARAVLLLTLGLGLGERDPAEAARLESLRRQEGDRLARVLGLEDGGLTPQPDRVSDPPRLTPPRSPRRLAVPVGLIGLALLCVWPLAELLTDHGGQTPAGLAEVDPLAALIAETYDCARVDARIDGDGALVVRGYAQSGGDRDGITAAIGTFPDLAPDRVEITVLPWPFCAVAGMVAGEATPDGPDAPQIAVRGVADGLAPGDNLVIDLTLAPETAGYLYVDLIDAAGQVVHLLPEPARPDNVLSDRTAWTLGTDAALPGPLERRWTVAGPPGQRMVLALVAPAPLFARLRPGNEPVTDYLDAVSAALREVEALGGGDRFPAGYMLFEVAE